MPQALHSHCPVHGQGQGAEGAEGLSWVQALLSNLFSPGSQLTSRPYWTLPNWFRITDPGPSSLNTLVGKGVT